MNTSQYGEVMKEALPLTLVAGAVVTEIDDTVITASELENVALWGLTFGAWFKIGLLIALVLLIAERATSTYRNIKETQRGSTST